VDVAVAVRHITATGERLTVVGAECGVVVAATLKSGASGPRNTVVDGRGAVDVTCVANISKISDLERYRPRQMPGPFVTSSGPCPSVRGRLS
jgi:hypothetical protein